MSASHPKTYRGRITTKLRDALSFVGQPQTREQQLELTQNDMTAMWNKLAGIDIKNEHGEITIGKVLRPVVGQDGSVDIVFELNDSQPAQFTYELLKKNQMKGLSLAHNRNTREPIEVSIVWQGAREGTGSLTDDNIRPVTVQSATAHQTVIPATATVTASNLVVNPSQFGVLAPQTTGVQQTQNTFVNASAGLRAQTGSISTVDKLYQYSVVPAQCISVQDSVDPVSVAMNTNPAPANATVAQNLSVNPATSTAIANTVPASAMQATLVSSQIPADLVSASSNAGRTQSQQQATGQTQTMVPSPVAHSVPGIATNYAHGSTLTIPLEMLQQYGPNAFAHVASNPKIANLPTHMYYGPPMQAIDPNSMMLSNAALAQAHLPAQQQQGQAVSGAAASAAMPANAKEKQGATNTNAKAGDAGGAVPMDTDSSNASPATKGNPDGQNEKDGAVGDNMEELFSKEEIDMLKEFVQSRGQTNNDTKNRIVELVIRAHTDATNAHKNASDAKKRSDEATVQATAVSKHALETITSLMGTLGATLSADDAKRAYEKAMTPDCQALMQLLQPAIVQASANVKASGFPMQTDTQELENKLDALQPGKNRRVSNRHQSPPINKPWHRLSAIASNIAGQQNMERQQQQQQQAVQPVFINGHWYYPGPAPVQTQAPMQAQAQATMPSPNPVNAQVPQQAQIPTQMHQSQVGGVPTQLMPAQAPVQPTNGQSPVAPMLFHPAYPYTQYMQPQQMAMTQFPMQQMATPMQHVLAPTASTPLAQVGVAQTNPPNTQSVPSTMNTAAAQQMAQRKAPLTGHNGFIIPEPGNEQGTFKVPDQVSSLFSGGLVQASALRTSSLHNAAMFDLDTVFGPQYRAAKALCAPESSASN